MDRKVEILLLINTNLLVLIWGTCLVLIVVFLRAEQRTALRNKKFPGINLKEFK
jgi:hypothetical protein